MAKNRLYGVTFLELMITIAIISVILYLAFDTYSGSINTQTAKSAIKQVGFALKTARYYAKANGVITHVNFPIGSSTYSIDVNDVPITNVSDFGANSGVLPGNAKVVDNTCADVYFYIDGTPLSAIDPEKTEFADHCSIIVGYEGGHQETLYLHAHSGSISYE